MFVHTRTRGNFRVILLIEVMESLIHKTNYPLKYKYNDPDLNKMLNYWLFLDEHESMILKLTGESLETILYSKYYWSSRFIDRYTNLHGADAGLEQCRDKILDEMDWKLNGMIDWETIQSLEEDTIQ